MRSDFSLKREVEEVDKVEIIPGVSVTSLRRFRAALIGPTLGFPPSGIGCADKKAWNPKTLRMQYFFEEIRTRLDLLSIPQSGGKNVKTFTWDHRRQIQNLFMAFKRVPRW